VPITDAGIDTAAFLKASEGVLGLFGTHLSPEFVPKHLTCTLRSPRIRRLHPRHVRPQGQHRCASLFPYPLLPYPLTAPRVQKVKERYAAAPGLSGTLQKLVENDDKKRKATQGLLWLLRGLSFTCKALQHAQANKADELAAAFQKSYEATLRQYHSILVRPVFSVR
jgi:hypothetical protein